MVRRIIDEAMGMSFLMSVMIQEQEDSQEPTLVKWFRRNES
jgi:hypothetical protein